MDATEFQPILAPQSPGPADEALTCSAETAECTCPDDCARDHGNE